MAINEPNITEIQPTDFISASRTTINDNFTEATELGTETRAGLVQLSTGTEVLTEANNVVMTPANTYYAISNTNLVAPKTDNLFDLGEVARQFKDAYIKNQIVLNGSYLTISGGNLLLDGVPVGGGSTGSFVTTNTSQNITANKTFNNANLIIDEGGSLEFLDNTSGTPNRGGITTENNTVIFSVIDDLYLYADNGVSFYNGTDVSYIKTFKSNVNYTQLPTTLGGTSYVDWAVAGAKTIFLDIDNSGQTIHIGDESTTVNLPDLYDSVNDVSHKGVKYTFVKTNSTASFQINSSSTVYSGSTDKIGDANLGSIDTISTDGIGVYHTITIESVYEGDINTNNFQGTWIVTSKMGTWV